MSDFLQSWQRRVSRDPMAIAIEFGATQWTRHALWTSALDLAQRLRDAGLQPNERVGIALERGPHWLVAALGVWIARGSWVALTTDLPPARIAAIEELARPRLRIEGPTLNIVGVDLPGRPRRTTGQEAYVIFSSGSTGRPKGIRVSHRGLLPMLRAQVAAFELGPRSRSLWALSPGFDASVSDWGTALLSGARLIITPPRSHVLSVLREAPLTHADIPPAVLGGLDPQRLPPSLHTLIVGGEVANAAEIRRLSASLRVICVYGPAECTVCTGFVDGHEHWNRAWIGPPMADNEYAIYTDGHEVRGDGEGELYITGPQLALGYVADPRRTRKRFVDIEGTRWYRTADRVRRVGDNYEFLGRLDRQLKIAGRLIAPEEVEAAIARHPAVRCVAVDVVDRGQRPRLIAHLECASDARPSDDEIAESVRCRLPEWMVPSAHEWHDRLPRGPSGKVDFSRLRDGPSRFLRPSPPRLESPRARAFAGAMMELLGVSEVRWTASWMAHGGDSLDALRMSSRLAREGWQVSPELLTSSTSLARIVSLPDARATSIRADILERDGHELATTHDFREHAPKPSHLPSTFASSKPEAANEPATTFLTGATGRLGGALARTLLDRGHRVVCLIRAPTPAAFEARFAELRRRLVGDSPDGRRLAAVHGDLSRPGLGLTRTHAEELSRHVAHIIHAAARVDLAASYHELRRTNVEALVPLVELAKRGRTTTLHHISSLAVFVSALPRTAIAREGDMPPAVDQLLGGYAQSKFAAECLLAGCDLESLVVHRLGLLFDEDGRDPPRLLSESLADLDDDAHRGDLAFDVTPTQWAAQVLVRLVEQGGHDAHRTRHIAGRRTMSAATLRELWQLVHPSTSPLRPRDESPSPIESSPLRPLTLYQAGNIVFEQSFRGEFPDLHAREPCARRIVSNHLQTLRTDQLASA